MKINGPLNGSIGPQNHPDPRNCDSRNNRHDAENW
jgi:hypothetical protein